ncbi:MAG TPA: hypothetical protein VKN99_16370 [Polyangia bacterium]|nr:hypothetical protein [Polyangia bacterium]
MKRPRVSVGKLLALLAGVLFLATVLNGIKNEEARENLWMIVSKGDNVPIVFMLFIVAFYVGWAFREAGRNDRLIEQGRRDEILKDMQR